MIGESLAIIKKQATILLLSSEQIDRGVIQEVLESKGYVVLPAGGIAGAVDWISRCTPDLLIVRPYLSGIAGHEAALYIRKKCHGIRILMVGGCLEDERIMCRSSLHAIEVFPPPFTAADFTGKVAEMLDSPSDESD